VLQALLEIKDWVKAEVRLATFAPPMLEVVLQEICCTGVGELFVYISVGSAIKRCVKPVAHSFQAIL
jgi:hypothetical protein